MKRMNIYMLTQVALAATCICMMACNGNTAKEWGIQKDSCLIRIMNKPLSSNIGEIDANAINNNMDTMVDFIVSFQTKKNLGKQSAQQQQLMVMDGAFGLMLDTTLVVPVFCQPIATGDSKKYTYWVSFEADKRAFAQANKQIIIQPNPIIKDSVHYKLL